VYLGYTSSTPFVGQLGYSVNALALPVMDLSVKKPLRSSTGKNLGILQFEVSKNTLSTYVYGPLLYVYERIM